MNYASDYLRAPDLSRRWIGVDASPSLSGSPGEWRCERVNEDVVVVAWFLYPSHVGSWVLQYPSTSPIHASRSTRTSLALVERSRAPLHGFASSIQSVVDSPAPSTQSYNSPSLHESRV